MEDAFDIFEENSKVAMPLYQNFGVSGKVSFVLNQGDIDYWWSNLIVKRCLKQSQE